MKDEKSNKLMIILIGGLVLLGIFAVALFTQIKKTHDTNNLDQLSSLKMDAIESDIKLDNKKLNIYFFWGSTCPHCKALFESLQDVYIKYQEDIFMYGFEVWENEANKDLMKRVAGVIEAPDDGVPLMIIGDKHFIGYYEGAEKEIEKEIEKQLKNKNNFDAYKELKEKENSNGSEEQ